MDFPVSGVHCSLWFPPAVAFVVAFVTAPAGISGAFLLLPFQMSVLGFTSPAVTPTNLIYNIVATPGGVYRYVREQRIAWPLARTIVAGTVPGIVLGALIRVRWLPDPRHAKPVIGLVLLFLGIRLLHGSGQGRPETRPVSGTVLRRTADFKFLGQAFSFSPAFLAVVSLFAGVIGGIYGVGGGALIAPLAVTGLGLPAHVVAGAALLGTLATSIAGVSVFQVVALTSLARGSPAQPDWILGLLFGAGGLLGSYCGARLQKHFPERWIRVLLALLVTLLGADYAVQFLR